MSTVSSSVTRQIAVDVATPDGGAIRMPVDLRYDMADPFAVQAIFWSGLDHEVRWTFARELLAAGVTSPAGEGDVQIWPLRAQGGDVLHIALTSPDGQALLQAAAGEVTDFLGAADALCAPGREAELLDVDTALEMLLTS